MIELTRRRYRCPDPCVYKCVIEMTSQYVKNPIQCAYGRGWIYDWILLDEPAGGERR